MKSKQLDLLNDKKSPGEYVGNNQYIDRVLELESHGIKIEQVKVASDGSGYTLHYNPNARVWSDVYEVSPTIYHTPRSWR